MSPSTYLDYNATAPLRPQALAAMTTALESCGNPSSVHHLGRRARAIIERARAEVAALVGASPDQVIFTSGGTEANNLALAGIPAKTILTSAVEHDSVLAAAPAAIRLPVDHDGVLSLQALNAALEQATPPSLVSVMFANNETGVIQPIARIADCVHAHGGVLHCDAVQAIGRRPVDMRALGIDYLTLSAHKIGGPAGVGALVVAASAEITPQMRGGGQERQRRAGTENVAGIAALGAVATVAAREATNTTRLSDLRGDLERRVRTHVPASQVYGAGADRLPNTSCIGLPGVSGEVQVINLDLAGVAVSAGAACSSGKVAPSHVLQAMGASREAAASAIRVSMGWATTAGDIDWFVDTWTEMAVRLTSEPVAA